jgi:membrane protein
VKKKLLTWIGIIKQSAVEFMGNNGLKYSAALAYYTIFSLAPMLLIIIWTGSVVFGREAIEGRVYSSIHEFVGETAALQIQDMISRISLQEDGTLAAIIGFATLLIGATVVFTEIQDTLNNIWGVKAKPKRGLLKLALNRVLSFSMIIGIGFLMLVSLVINTMLSALSDLVRNIVPEAYFHLTMILNFLLTFVIITSLFVFIFKFLPDAKIRWKDVITGALATAVLFIIGKFGISMYLNFSDMGSAYGAAGSVVVILAWVYYSSIILFFGAEFTQVYAKHLGKGIIPAEYAVLVEKREIEKEY